MDMGVPDVKCFWGERVPDVKCQGTRCEVFLEEKATCSKVVWR